MDLYIVFPLRDDEEVPPAPPTIHIDPDESLAGHPELGRYATVLQQDFDNLERVQRGLLSSTKGAISLAAYQESRIRKYHQTIDAYVRADTALIDRVAATAER